MGNAREILRAHSSATPSKWREQAEFRRSNKELIRKSQLFALTVLDLMEERGLNQQELALKLGVTQQYVSKILKGTENFSFETVTKIENIFNCSIIDFNIIKRNDRKCIFKSELEISVIEVTNFNGCNFAFNS